MSWILNIFASPMFAWNTHSFCTIDFLGTFCCFDFVRMPWQIDMMTIYNFFQAFCSGNLHTTATKATVSITSTTTTTIKTTIISDRNKMDHTYIIVLTITALVITAIIIVVAVVFWKTRTRYPRNERISNNRGAIILQDLWLPPIDIYLIYAKPK